MDPSDTLHFLDPDDDDEDDVDEKVGAASVDLTATAATSSLQVGEVVLSEGVQFTSYRWGYQT